jgi:DNA-binding CsgD family transcriptional regulator
MAAHDPPADWDRDLPPRPISEELWRALVADLRLSPQQARIVDLIHRDLEYDEIARRLGISERVVRDYLKRVCLRLGVRRRSGLVLYAYARSHALRH